MVTIMSLRPFRDWSLIAGRWGGYEMGKSRVQNFLRAPPPPAQDRVKLFKEWKLFAPPPRLSIWLKLQAPV